MGDVAEAMHARFFVHFHRADADEAGELAGRLAPLQIHLEKTILRVRKAQRPRDVLPRLRR